MRSLLLLVADRSEARLAYYRAGLADDFCTVVPVTTTAQCLTMLQEFTPDVMVLEAELPGAERVLDALAHQPTGARAVVVVQSTSGRCPNPPSLARFLRSEMWGRPLPPAELASRIRQLLSAGRGRKVRADLEAEEGQEVGAGPETDVALLAGKRLAADLQTVSWN
jgi:CheY-like chemotaxis protein